MTEVLVLGAGPAGLEAAKAACDRGARVTVLDAADQPGGQYWRHLPDDRAGAREHRLHHGWAAFGELREVLRHPRCRWIPSASVWAIEPADPAAVHVVVGLADGTRRESLTIRPDALVLATGAHDRTLPFPGWDLPGVFTGGAAQALAKGERVAVGERVLVAGAGPFLFPVASSLLCTGCTVVELVEASRSGRLAAGWLSRPWELARTAAKGAELGGYARELLAHRVPYRTGSAVVAAHGGSRVEAVTVARLDADWRPRPGTERTVEVDAVCVTHAFTPRLELAVATGCALRRGFVAVGDDQRTSVPGVFAAGEITGIGGVDLARAEGALAGAVAAGAFADEPGPARLRRRIGRYRAFARRLERAHRVGAGWPCWLTDGTLICRCEEVTAGELRRVAQQTDAANLRSVKLASRAGLGICQGRICGRTVEQLLAAGTPLSAHDPARPDHRPIAVPLRLGELAGIPKTIPTAAPTAPPTREEHP